MQPTTTTSPVSHQRTTSAHVRALRQPCLPWQQQLHDLPPLQRRVSSIYARSSFSLPMLTQFSSLLQLDSRTRASFRSTSARPARGSTFPLPSACLTLYSQLLAACVPLANPLLLSSLSLLHPCLTPAPLTVSLVSRVPRRGVSALLASELLHI